MSRRRRLADYYRQFEALSPAENSQRLRERRGEERSQELARVPDLDMSGTAWHEPPDPEIINAATFALRRSINRYPDPPQPPGPAVHAIARRHDVPVDRVALGHGAGQLLQAALRELAGGGEALMPWPSWGPLPALAGRAGVRGVPVPLASDGSADLDALAAAATDATRAVVICSPNDPTGALVAREALRDFTAALRPDVSVLVDEALVELAGEGASVAPLVQMISVALHPSHPASCSRASSSALSARAPSRCGLDGLPMKSRVARSQASRATSLSGWVAL